MNHADRIRRLGTEGSICWPSSGKAHFRTGIYFIVDCDMQMPLPAEIHLVECEAGYEFGGARAVVFSCCDKILP